MNSIVQSFVRLHVAPDEWSVEQYVQHAFKMAVIVWVVLTATCAGVGLATGDPDDWMGEFALYTYYTVFVLATCSVVCKHCANAVPAGSKSLWNLMHIGFLFLAADDLFLIHENIDKLIHWMFGADRDHPITNHLDDLIVLTFGVIGALIVWRKRSEILSLRYFVKGMCFALGFLLLMVFFDAVGGVWGHVGFVVEEAFKGLGASAFFVTLVAARIQLRRRYAGQSNQPQAVQDPEPATKRSIPAA